MVIEKSILSFARYRIVSASLISPFCRVFLCPMPYASATGHPSCYDYD
jgi:hypothetical protein